MNEEPLWWCFDSCCKYVRKHCNVITKNIYHINGFTVYMIVFFLSCFAFVLFLTINSLFYFIIISVFSSNCMFLFVSLFTFRTIIFDGIVLNSFFYLCLIVFTVCYAGAKSKHIDCWIYLITVPCHSCTQKLYFITLILNIIIYRQFNIKGVYFSSREFLYTSSIKWKMYF